MFLFQTPHFRASWGWGELTFPHGDGLALTSIPGRNCLARHSVRNIEGADGQVEVLKVPLFSVAAKGAFFRPRQQTGRSFQGPNADVPNSILQLSTLSAIKIFLTRQGDTPPLPTNSKGSTSSTGGSPRGSRCRKIAITKQNNVWIPGSSRYRCYPTS